MSIILSYRIDRTSIDYQFGYSYLVLYILAKLKRNMKKLVGRKNEIATFKACGASYSLDAIIGKIRREFLLNFKIPTESIFDFASFQSIHVIFKFI